MKFNSHLPSFHISSSFRETAATNTESAGNKRAPETSPPPDLQPENKKPRRDYFPPLLARQNATSGQSSDRPPSASEQAKERIIQSTDKASRSEGWVPPLRQESNVVWESPASPILIKRELSLQQLKLTRADIANGSFGSVSIFENENGDKLIGKISDPDTRAGKGIVIVDLADELKAYQTIYDAVGPHPNLVNVYGIAEVPHKEETKRTMLMDFIPGPTGKDTFDALRKCWDAGKISSEQYWGAMQFIARRLLDVTGHLGNAGVVHNDIKPENFLVNKETGEPVLIDLGFWSKKDEWSFCHTPGYAAPEVEKEKYHRVDERNDVFAVGASLLDGIEGGKVFPPNKGLHPGNAFKNHEGNVVRKPGSYSAKTAYTEFMNSVMAREKDRRGDSEKAKKFDFLNHSMLDDDAAKEIIKKAISLAGIEEQKEEQKLKKEQGEQAKPQLFLEPKKESQKHVSGLTDAVKNNPDPEDHARLQNASKNDPRDRRMRRLARHMRVQGQVEQDMKKSAMQFITNATWSGDTKRILETVPTTIKSGVDKDGRRLLYGGNKNIDPDYERSVISARQNLAPYAAEIENLRHYVNGAEKFLLNVRKLKPKSDSEIAQKIEQVRERAAVARRIVEIFDTDLSQSEKGNAQERAPELEGILLSRQSKKDEFQERFLELESLLEQIKYPNNPPASE